MTEEEWIASDQSYSMLRSIRHRSSDRKLRLTACAYCRSVWDLFSKASRRAITLGEELADGPVDVSHQDAVVRSAIESVMRFDRTSGKHFFAADIAYRVAINDGWYAVEWTTGNWRNLQGGVHIVRDIFGNPFRPVALDPAWRTSTAVGIAQGIYDDRAFDRMPILADAIQDAGCENAEILNHCRGDGPHVRGCWVVDLVLGKE